jgi:3-oxoacyl-[acyl-carrier protein] reductase
MVNDQDPSLLLVHMGLPSHIQAQLASTFSCTALDLREWEDTEQLAGQLNMLGEKLPHLRIVVIFVPMANIAAERQLDTEWFEHQFEQIFVVTQFAAQRLMATGQMGQLVLVQSVMGEVGHPDAATSSVLAGATLGLMKSLAKEVARYQVSVNIIALGNSPTLGYQLYLDTDYAKMFSMTGLGSEVIAQQVNAGLVYLHQSAMATTGQVLRLDSGLVI